MTDQVSQVRTIRTCMNRPHRPTLSQASQHKRRLDTD